MFISDTKIGIAVGVIATIAAVLAVAIVGIVLFLHRRSRAKRLPPAQILATSGASRNLDTTSGASRGAVGASRSAGNSELDVFEMCYDIFDNIIREFIIPCVHYNSRCYVDPIALGKMDLKKLVESEGPELPCPDFTDVSGLGECSQSEIYFTYYLSECHMRNFSTRVLLPGTWKNSSRGFSYEGINLKIIHIEPGSLAGKDQTEYVMGCLMRSIKSYVDGRFGKEEWESVKDDVVELAQKWLGAVSRAVAKYADECKDARGLMAKYAMKKKIIKDARVEANNVADQLRKRNVPRVVEENDVQIQDQS